jgi:hypothetical protein
MSRSDLPEDRVIKSVFGGFAFIIGSVAVALAAGAGGHLKQRK